MKVNETLKTGKGSLAVVIMAAGKGTRLKSKRPKVLHEIGGKPLLAHVIAAASQVVAPEKIFVVIGHEAEHVRAAVAGSGVQFVVQTEQRGTGHAIQCAKAAIQDYENVLVLSGDAPLIRSGTVECVWRFSPGSEGGDDAALRHPGESAWLRPGDPQGAGQPWKWKPSSSRSRSRMGRRGSGKSTRGMYAFRTKPLLAHLDELSSENPNGEFYLTDMAGILRAAGEGVVAIEARRTQMRFSAPTPSPK